MSIQLPNKRHNPEPEKYEYPPNNNKKQKKIPHFIRELHKILKLNEHPKIIKWTASGKSFEIRSPSQMTEVILPLYWKHKNYASFVRQLNHYGFKKEQKYSKVEIFCNPLFTRGGGMLHDIKRTYTNNKQKHKIHIPKDTEGIVKQRKSRSGSVIEVEIKTPNLPQATIRILTDDIQYLTEKTDNLETFANELGEMHSELQEQEALLYSSFYQLREREQILDFLLRSIFTGKLALSKTGKGHLALVRNKHPTSTIPPIATDIHLNQDLQFWFRKLLLGEEQNPIIRIPPAPSAPLNMESSKIRAHLKKGEIELAQMLSNCLEEEGSGCKQMSPGKRRKIRIKININDTDYSIFKLEKAFDALSNCNNSCDEVIQENVEPPNNNTPGDDKYIFRYPSMLYTPEDYASDQEEREGNRGINGDTGAMGGGEWDIGFQIEMGGTGHENSLPDNPNTYYNNSNSNSQQGYPIHRNLSDININDVDMPLTQASVSSEQGPHCISEMSEWAAYPSPS